MKYEAVIFDLDGVICCTDQYHYLAWKQLANRLNIPFDRTVNQKLRGVSRAESLDIILAGAPGRRFTQAEKQVWMEEKNETYRKMLEAMTPNDLSLQVKVTLDALRAGGLKLGIGSSSRNARLILDRIGLGKYFDAVTDGTEISHSKPDPEVFLTTARKLTRAPAECLVVEDAPAGIEAACRAGMDSAAVGEVAARHPGRTYALGMFRDLLKVTGVEGGKS